MKKHYDALARQAYILAAEKGHDMGSFRASAHNTFVSFCHVCDAHMTIDLDATVTQPVLSGQALDQTCAEAFR